MEDVFSRNFRLQVSQQCLYVSYFDSNEADTYFHSLSSLFEALGFTGLVLGVVGKFV